MRTDGALVVLDLSAVPAPATSPAAESTDDGTVGSRRLPPPALLLAGTLSVVKGAVGLTAGLLALTSLATLALWVAALARRGWARTALMAVCAVEATAELAHVSVAAGRPGAAVLLNAGAAVLILILVSSDEARRWAARERPTAA